MRRNSAWSERFLHQHEWVRFVLLTVYLSALASFAGWRAVSEITDHPDERAWLWLALAGGSIICLVAWVTVLGVSRQFPPKGVARGLSRQARIVISAALSVAAVVALVPKRTSPLKFWQPGWVQAIGAGFWLAFAVLVIVRRIHQKAWRGFGAQ